MVTLPKRSGSALLASVLLLLLGGTAAAHMPPPIYCEADVNEEEMEFRIYLLTAVPDHWLTLEREEGKETPDLTTAAAEEKIAEAANEWLEVKVDRLRVEGVLKSAEVQSFSDHQMTWTYAAIKLHYGLKGRPKQISVTWRKYDWPDGWYVAEVDAEILGFGVSDYAAFKEREPEFVWHPPLEDVEPVEFVKPTVKGPDTADLPVVSVALLGLLVLLLPLFRLLGVGRKTAWPVGLGCLALAVALSGTATVAVEVPWSEGWVPPTPAEAKLVFETLHRNIYRAFDYDEEEKIYDTLAQSVRGDLLDRIYLEVYRSLILQDQGGAVCTIQKTEVLDSEVEFPSDPKAPWFSVLCRWRVYGKVGHWGHTHRRVNEHEARYTVSRDGEEWKIAAVEVLEQKRVDDGGLGDNGGSDK